MAPLTLKEETKGIECTTTLIRMEQVSQRMELRKQSFPTIDFDSENSRYLSLSFMSLILTCRRLTLATNAYRLTFALKLHALSLPVVLYLSWFSFYDFILDLFNIKKEAGAHKTELVPRPARLEPIPKLKTIYSELSLYPLNLSLPILCLHYVVFCTLDSSTAINKSRLEED